MKHVLVTIAVGMLAVALSGCGKAPHEVAAQYHTDIDRAFADGNIELATSLTEEMMEYALDLSESQKAEFVGHWTDPTFSDWIADNGERVMNHVMSELSGPLKDLEGLSNAWQEQQRRRK